MSNPSIYISALSLSVSGELAVPNLPPKAGVLKQKLKIVSTMKCRMQ